jgi:hypothetical protein
MMRFSSTLKTTALAGLFGLGLIAASSPALADRVYTRCDSDGDRCYRVVCDNDGDECQRYRINTSNYNNYYRYNRYYDNDRYNSNYYNRNNYGRRWVCDSDGDRCHWSYDRW